MHSGSGHLNTDVLIVGAGPAGLACAIRLARESKGALHIMVLEKSAHPGGHLLSGAVMRPKALNLLLTPSEWAAIPLESIVKRDSFHALVGNRSFRLPIVPSNMRMKGLPLVSVSALARSLCQIATNLGVEILMAQTANTLLWNGDRVTGVETQGDRILAPTTVLAEGPAGLLTRELLSRHPELNGRHLQTHGLGLKECFEIPENAEATGTVAHTFGFPLGLDVYGGGFIYHVDARHVALGLAMALDYTDPAVHPHEWFRQWKRHPFVQSHIAGGKVLEYGARLVPEGGWHSLSRLDAPGAFIIGDAAGLVDTMELKGLHLAIESGMAAANAILHGTPIRPEDIPSLDGLRRTANYRAAFRAGLPFGMAAAGLSWLSGGHLPWGRIAQRNERTCLHPAFLPPAPRDKADRNSSDLGLESDLYLAHLRIREDAVHIQIREPARCATCFQQFAAPCRRFCPANVYEADEQEASIRIRAENCLQCRCCTLKCPLDNIHWNTPCHGVGPDYSRM